MRKWQLSPILIYYYTIATPNLMIAIKTRFDGEKAAWLKSQEETLTKVWANDDDAVYDTVDVISEGKWKKYN